MSSSCIYLVQLVISPYSIFWGIFVEAGIDDFDGWLYTLVLT